MSQPKDKPGASTSAVHDGEREGRPRVSDSLTTPIVQSSTYWFRDTQEVIDYQEGRHQSFEYGRYGNPTTRAAEEKLRLLEEGEACVLSASGMNSVTTMLLALVPAGGRIVTTRDCYRRTRQFIATVLPKMGIEATIIDPGDLDALERALNNRVDLFFSESPTNPYLRVVDIPRVSELCHARNATVVIDSTFATPVNQRALGLGADLVLHSATKYLAGHNDVIAGVLIGRADLLKSVRELHGILGGVLDPHAAYLLLRGTKTLALRVARANENAMAIARYLAAHPSVERVHYPGLESHPDHGVAREQMSGYGGVVSFEIPGGLEAASKFVDALRIPYIAPSLGGVESLVEQPTVISYWDQTPEQRAEIGIRDNLVRYSCGIEDIADLIADIDQALERI
jgi:cystathionine gamma-synthase